MEKEFALVLSGGGTRGAYQVGVWKALQDLGIKVKAITGTSIGSLNGALILQGDTDGMIDIYKNLKMEDFIIVENQIDAGKDLFDKKNIKAVAKEYLNKKGFDNAPLRETINKHIDLKKIYESDIDFGLVTYSIDNGSSLQLFKDQIPKDEFVDFLLASCCFPLYKTQKIGNFEFVDGAFYDNVPINMLIDKGYKNIIVADINGFGLTRRMKDKNVYLKVIAPKEKIGGMFEFNHDRINNNMALGYLDTMRSFNKMQGHIYYFHTNEFNRMLNVFNLQTIYGLENAAKVYEMNKYKAYNFEEFIEELTSKHLEAKEKYEKIKGILSEKNMTKLKENVDDIFKGNLGICFAMDVYLEKPMSKRFDYLRKFMQDYFDSVEALIELERYLK